MAMTDVLGDMLARIRNGQMVYKVSVMSPFSQLRMNVLEVLKQEGFIRGFETVDVRKGIKEIRIDLKYHEGKGAIHEMKRVSKPGRRVYAAALDIPKVRNGLGVAILSTARGVMTDHQARRENVGGEILCNIF